MKKPDFIARQGRRPSGLLGHIVAAGPSRKAAWTLKPANAASLPSGDESFDKAYCVHTICFWANLEEHLREVLRLLRPRRRFVLGFRPHEDPKAVAPFPSSIYRFPTVAEAQTALKLSGFAVVRTVTLCSRAS